MRTGVVAGNYKQFVDYVTDQAKKGKVVEFAAGRTEATIDDEKYFYVVHFEQLIGRRGIELQFHGTYQDRGDIDDIHRWNIDRRYTG